MQRTPVTRSTRSKNAATTSESGKKHSVAPIQTNHKTSSHDQPHEISPPRPTPRSRQHTPSHQSPSRHTDISQRTPSRGNSPYRSMSPRLSIAGSLPRRGESQASSHQDHGPSDDYDAPRAGATPRNRLARHNSPTTRNTTTAMSSPTSLEDWRKFFRALSSPQMSMPEYSGFEHEDPDVFLEECEDYFDKQGIDYQQWTRMAGKSLQDDAARWWTNYRNLKISWTKFCELLRQKFASRETIMRLTAALYSRKQGEKEDVGIFLEKHHLLARRLLRDTGETNLVALLLESLKPSLKKLLRLAPPDTVADLISKATQLEQDEAGETPKLTKKKDEAAPTAKPRFTNDRNAPTKEEPFKPKCWHCPERHFHVQCPVLKEKQKQQSENWRKPAQVTGSAAEETNRPL